MISFAERSLASFVAVLSSRADKFSLALDQADAETCVIDCIRVLNDTVSCPRVLYFNNTSTEIDMPEDVDEIANVKFSDHPLDNWIKEFGFLPLVSRTFPLGSFEQATEFLMLKGNLNMLSRHLKFAPDWEYYPPKLIVNRAYEHIVVEYLPHLDPERTVLDDPAQPTGTSHPSWILTQSENTYVLDRAWCLFNERNAEALLSAQNVGVGQDYAAVLEHWSSKLKELDEKFQANGVVTAIG